MRSRFARLKFASIAASWRAICSLSQRPRKLRGEHRASLRRSFARRRMAGHHRCSCRQGCSRSRQSRPRQPHSPTQCRTSRNAPHLGQTNRSRTPRSSGIGHSRRPTMTELPAVSITMPAPVRETLVSGTPAHLRRALPAGSRSGRWASRCTRASYADGSWEGQPGPTPSPRIQRQARRRRGRLGRGEPHRSFPRTACGLNVDSRRAVHELSVGGHVRN